MPENHEAVVAEAEDEAGAADGGGTDTEGFGAEGFMSIVVRGGSN